MYGARLDTTVPAALLHRLRMAALVDGVAVNRVLVKLLDKELPSTDELAAILAKGPRDADEPAEVAA